MPIALRPMILRAMASGGMIVNFGREVGVNSPADLTTLATAMRDRAILPEIEIFDAGMINAARYFESKGPMAPADLRRRLGRAPGHGRHGLDGGIRA